MKKNKIMSKKTRELDSTFKVPLDFSVIESDTDIEIEDFETFSSFKHKPSRKRKEGMRRKSTVEYRKNKNKKWIKKDRKESSIKVETSNRSFMNKASMSYIKLKPHI